MWRIISITGLACGLIILVYLTGFNSGYDTGHDRGVEYGKTISMNLEDFWIMEQFNKLVTEELHTLDGDYEISQGVVVTFQGPNVVYYLNPGHEELAALSIRNKLKPLVFDNESGHVTKENLRPLARSIAVKIIKAQ